MTMTMMQRVQFMLWASFSLASFGLAAIVHVFVEQPLTNARKWLVRR